MNNDDKLAGRIETTLGSFVAWHAYWTAQGMPRRTEPLMEPDGSHQLGAKHRGGTVVASIAIPNCRAMPHFHGDGRGNTQWRP